MGVDYIWVCDERKEYIDTNRYPGTADLYVRVYCDLGEWRDCQIRLLSDCGGTNWEYYERTHDSAQSAIDCGDSPDRIYKEVTEEASKLFTEMYPDYEPGG